MVFFQTFPFTDSSVENPISFVPEGGDNATVASILILGDPTDNEDTFTIKDLIVVGCKKEGEL